MIEKLAAELAPRLAQARYMEENPKPVRVAGWEGFPTVQCTYSVQDKALNTNKTADGYFARSGRASLGAVG